MEGSISTRASPDRIASNYRTLIAGVFLSAAVSALAVGLAPHMPKALPLPAMVIALIIAMALHPFARNTLFQPGLTFCAKPMLRWAVALLGMRVAVNDIIGLGVPVAMLVIVSMVATIVAGIVFAKLLKQNPLFGVLVGCGTAVCGASATLATSTILPNYEGRDTDVAFVIVGVNLLATLAMLAYPPLCFSLGFDDRTTGVMLGGTIHDVAQVVGAGYAISDTAGNAAAIVKLSRVFMLLPVVLVMSWYVTRLTGRDSGEARVAVPMFAVMFLVLCIANSVLTPITAIAHEYQFIKSLVVALSTWGLLLAIAAIGLNTSIKALAYLGWRHIANLVGSSAVILFIVTVGLFLYR